MSRLLQEDVRCVAGKRERYDWTLRLEDANGARCGLGASDVVKFRLATTEGGAALLSFTSSAASANGSSVNIVSRGSSSTDANGTVTLQGADTTTYGGTAKRYELVVIDAADSNREAVPVRGKMVFLPSIV